MDAIVGENLLDSPIIYFFEGLIEGFVSFMSNQKTSLVPEVVEIFIDGIGCLRA